MHTYHVRVDVGDDGDDDEERFAFDRRKRSVKEQKS